MIIFGIVSVLAITQVVTLLVVLWEGAAANRTRGIILAALQEMIKEQD